jgi:N-acetylglucosaminyldiphosphoundecaprenol N-acetyl-beta-D-mannosaminyltransferase
MQFMERKKAKVQGYEIDLFTLDEALSHVARMIEGGQNAQIVTINPEMIELAHKNAEFSDALKQAELTIPDGAGIKIALRLKGAPAVQIRGIDFARALIALCNEKPYRLALLGAKEEVISKVVENLRASFKNVNIVFSQNGYFDDENKVISKLKQAAPQVLLCALGAPRQDILLHKLKNELQGCAMVGVGGSFDVFAGTVVEAPVVFRKLHLEWLYRTLKQPERFKRIFPTLPNFLFRSIMEGVRCRIKGE